jgi:hypothetical protein
MRYEALLAAAVLGIAAPMGVGIEPVIAQQQFNLTALQLYAGTTIPVSLSGSQTTQYYYPDTSYPLALTVPQNIYNSGGWLVIPAGSQIVGELRPVTGGLRFYGHTLQVNGHSYAVQVSSDTIHDRKDPREYATGAIVGDAAIGAAGGALIGAVTGDVDAAEVLGGAAAGVGVGNITAPQVVVLHPNQTFDVRFDSALRW